MKKRITALLFITLILTTMGVSVFAQQPNIKSPSVQYLGFWQNTPQNQGYLTSWIEDICPDCGTHLYSITLGGMGHRPLNDGDILSIIDTTETTRLESYYDMGICSSIDNPQHTPEDHKNGSLCYRNYNNSTILYANIPKTTTGAMFVWLVCPYDALYYDEYYQFWDTHIDGASNNAVRGYASASITQTYYTDRLIEELYTLGYLDGVAVPNPEAEKKAYANGYADGQINAQKNAEAFQLFDEVFGGVLEALNPILTMEIYGVSIMWLIYLMCTLTIILLIVKVVRG